MDFSNISAFLVMILFAKDYVSGENIDTKSADCSSASQNSLAEQKLNCIESTNSLPRSRRKRYVAFPEGSSFSVAACETIGLIGNPQKSFITWALNWGVIYDLPNDTWIINERNRKAFPKPIEQRRHRRDLYNHLETVIDNMGYNGRACVLRALCESSQFFHKKSPNMVEELIRTVFTLPKMKVLPFEHPDLISHYDKAFREGKNRMYCASIYRDCGFSLLKLALGENLVQYSFM